MTQQTPSAARWRWLLPALFVAGPAGPFAGYVNTLHSPPLHNDLSAESLLIVFTVSSIAGCISPRSAWVSALLVGLGLPFAHILVATLAIPVPRPLPARAADLLALFPSFLGAGAGAFWRVFLLRPVSRDFN